MLGVASARGRCDQTGFAVDIVAVAVFIVVGRGGGEIGSFDWVH